MESAGKRVCKNRKQPIPRSGHVAVTYGDLMLVWGGYSELPPFSTSDPSDQYLDGKELWYYNIEAQIWDLWDTRSSPPGMSGSCAACVRNHMYVFGGFNENGNSNELFRLNLKTRTWTRLKTEGKPPSPRDKLTCWPYEDKLIFFGGFGPPSDDEHTTNSSKGEWRLDPTSVRLWSDVMIRGWNNHVYVYNITNNTWSSVKAQTNQPSPRAAHACVVLGNRGYMFGGRFANNRLNDVHFFDLETMLWSGSLPVNGESPIGRSWHCMAPVSDRHFLVYGGYSTDNVPLYDVWVFNVDSLTWHQQPSLLSETRMWHTAVRGTDAGEAIVFGGCANNLLDPEGSSVHSKKVISFFFSPKSLARLGIEAIVRDIDVLQSELSSLPAILHKKIEMCLPSPAAGAQNHEYNLRSRHRSL